MEYYRHGDLIICPISSLPEGEYKEVESFVLAESETTGHKHTLVAERPTKIRIFTNENGQHILDLSGSAVITHEEHKTLTIKTGFYVVKTEQEFDYALESIKSVQD